MRVLRNLFVLLFVAGLGLALTVFVPEYRKGTRLLSVQSNSMEPVFAPGDGLIMKSATVADLEVDDVVSYRSPTNPRVIVSHRLLDFDYDAGMLITQGENEEELDSEVSPNQVVGKVTQVIPRAGYVIDFLHTPVGLISAVYLPGILILFSEVKRLVKRISRPAYRLYGYNRHLKHRRA